MRPFLWHMCRIIGGGISGSILALRAHMSGHSIDWWKYGRPLHRSAFGDLQSGRLETIEAGLALLN